MSASASAQFLLTSKTSHAMNSILRWRIQIADAEDEACALFDRGAAPGPESFERGLHCRFDVVFVGFLVDAHDLRRLRRVQRLDLVGCLDALAADDEVILVAQLSANLGDRGAHAARVVFVAKIKERLSHKCTLMQGSSAAGRGFPTLPSGKILSEIRAWQFGSAEIFYTSGAKKRRVRAIYSGSSLRRIYGTL